MFAIYRKTVAGRVHDRYFVSNQLARRELNADVERMCDVCHAQVTERIDRMNEDKGFWEYEVRMRVNTGTIVEQASLAIVDGYFEDEPNE